ncbi:MAG: hypothetical protein WC725_04815 [Patescibacteria group bacterium]|jgi:hypothetical protein
MSNSYTNYITPDMEYHGKHIIQWLIEELSNPGRFTFGSKTIDEYMHKSILNNLESVTYITKHNECYTSERLILRDNNAVFVEGLSALLDKDFDSLTMRFYSRSVMNSFVSNMSYLFPNTAISLHAYDYCIGSDYKFAFHNGHMTDYIYKNIYD